jgi:hypothetical protein
MLLVDERCLQSDLVGADRIVPVVSVAASRDLDASSLTKIFAPKRNDFVVKTGLKCLGKCISQEVTMKDLVQCRKLEAKFRQLAVSDPTKRFIWLAEAEKWEHEAEAEIASHFEACNAVRTAGAIDQ